VRKLAKLILFFSSTFFIIFAAVTVVRFLSLRVDWARSLPPKPETALTLLISAAHWALSFSLFSSIIISLNYAVRRKCKALLSVPCIMLLSFFLCFGISFLLDQWKSVPPSQSIGIPLGSEGLILSNSLSKNETAVVLLNGSSEPFGPRVTAIPDLPLTYSNSATTNFDLPLVPFGDDTPWYLKNLSIDIRLNAEMFQRKFLEGFFPFFIYVGSLIFLLCSLGYVMKFSVWPLANLFLASLAFGGILTLITFLNTPEIQEVIDSFLNKLIPTTLALPLFFLGFGLLLNAYSLLTFAAKRRLDYDY